MAELYQFISNSTTIDLDIMFRCPHYVEVEGIEFQPLDRVQHELLLENEEVDLQTDTYWEQKLPSDYEDIIKKSKNCVEWTTKKELYSILRKGCYGAYEYLFKGKNSIIPKQVLTCLWEEMSYDISNTGFGTYKFSMAMAVFS
ncbi:unnamed protein product [Lactuca virosa]|uniref:Uncharacterized protein n=1 Tax=Lactuca virosa TaxID=75947 RepID=A0AAU9MMN6_9ASTR|nr:unnamed protein product [Lactuca virosa]